PDPDDAGVKTWLPDLAQLCRNAGCASFRYIMPDAKTGDIDKRLRAGELLVDMIQAAAPWAAPAQAGGDGMMVANGQPISLADHFLTTCYSMKTRPTLYRHRGDFHTWNKCAYQTLSDEALSAQLYRHLEGLSVITPEGPRPIIPKANLISEIIKALPSRNILLPDDFETPGWLDRKDHPRPADLVACHNGLLHLPTLTLHEPTPVFFNQTSVDCDFDPGAAFPSAWIAFLTDLWGSDEESISLLQEWFGYLISPDTSQHKIGVIIGPPRSGKGTLARVARSILGERSTCGPTLGALAEGFGLQCLIGKSLAIIADARLGGRSDAAAITERLVSISGEDALNVPRKHQVDWYGKLLARFWIMTNEIPRFTDSSGALASRLLVWRLIRSFLGHEDHHLLDRLLAEKDSIFLWAVEGWQRLNARGYFIQPSSAADLCESISDLTSPVLAFIRECCHVNPLSDVSTKELFDAWTKWNREMGREHVGSAQVFGRDLRAALPQVEIKQYRVGSERLRYWTGIGLGQE
ncbi:MAG: phage/plasmid primase, P4 family, partial [Candidatus Sumerlaeota bacterium]|nr:phage/plasmid primase, P4 family [Candidatus Sumerlaeota bacterium]